MLEDEAVIFKKPASATSAVLKELELSVVPHAPLLPPTSGRGICL